MPSTLESCVQRGAAFLDAEKPGWRDSINLATLRMDSGTQCVCGQVFRTDASTIETGYDYALDAYGGSLWAEQHGFEQSHEVDEDTGTRPYTYLELAAAWSQVIAPTRVEVLA